MSLSDVWRTTLDFAAMLATLLLYGFIWVMLLAFGIGLPAAIIDLILPGSPLGLQAWSEGHPNQGNYR